MKIFCWNFWISIYSVQRFRETMASRSATYLLTYIFTRWIFPNKVVFNGMASKLMDLSPCPHTWDSTCGINAATPPRGCNKSVRIRIRFKHARERQTMPINLHKRKRCFLFKFNRSASACNPCKILTLRVPRLLDSALSLYFYCYGL